MPIVKKEARYVRVAYELCCGFERATALAADMCRELKADPGLYAATDDTRGWDGDRMAVIIVDYATLADANRLDAKVRALLSRNGDFTYAAHYGESYGSRGPSLTVDASTTFVTHEAD